MHGQRLDIEGLHEDPVLDALQRDLADHQPDRGRRIEATLRVQRLLRHRQAQRFPRLTDGDPAAVDQQRRFITIMTNGVNTSNPAAVVDAVVESHVVRRRNAHAAHRPVTVRVTELQRAVQHDRCDDLGLGTLFDECLLRRGAIICQ